MSIVVEQKWNGSEVSLGSDGKAEIRSEYVIRGTNDEFAAYDALEMATLDAVGGLVKTHVEITGRLSEIAWEGEVSWFAPTFKQPKRKVIEEDGFSFSFDTGGGTEHITQSLGTTAYAPDGLTPPDNQGAIGVTKDAVEGVDIAAGAQGAGPAQRGSRLRHAGDHRLGLQPLHRRLRAPRIGRHRGLRTLSESRETAGCG